MTNKTSPPSLEAVSLPKNLIEILAFKAYGERVVALLKFSYTNPFGLFNPKNTLQSYSLVNLENKKDYDNLLTLDDWQRFIKKEEFIDEWLQTHTYSNSYNPPQASIALCTPRLKLVVENVEEILKKEVLNRDILNYSVVNFDLHKILAPDIKKNTYLKENDQKIFLNNYLLTLSYKFLACPYSAKEALRLLEAHSIEVMHRAFKLKLKTRYNAEYITALYPMKVREEKLLNFLKPVEIKTNELEEYRPAFNITSKATGDIKNELKKYLGRWYSIIQQSAQYIEYEKKYFTQTLNSLPTSTPSEEVAKKPYKI